MEHFNAASITFHVDLNKLKKIGGYEFTGDNRFASEFLCIRPSTLRRWREAAKTKGVIFSGVSKRTYMRMRHNLSHMFHEHENLPNWKEAVKHYGVNSLPEQVLPYTVFVPISQFNVFFNFAKEHEIIVQNVPR